MRFENTTPYTQADYDLIFPEPAVVGGPTGFEVQGYIEVEYTAPVYAGYTQGGVVFEIKGTNGWDGQWHWFPPTVDGNERLTKVLPIYTTLWWPEGEEYKVWMTLQAVHAQATVFSARGEITLKRATELLA